MALALRRAGALSFLPPDELPLQVGDSLLFTGRPGVASRMEWVLGAANVLEYVESGAEFPDAWVFRWLDARRRRAADRGA
jgi:hypothetical protein